MEAQGFSAKAVENVRLFSREPETQECANQAMQHAVRQKEAVTTKAKVNPASIAKLEVSSPPSEEQIASAVGTFADVYKLLEEYGPAWYSSKMRRKLQTALRSVRYFLPSQD